MRVVAGRAAAIELESQSPGRASTGTRDGGLRPRRDTSSEAEGAPLHGRETFITRAADDGAAPRVSRGDWVWVDPDEPAVHGRLVAAWVADGGESATMVRLMVEDGGRRVLRALDPHFPDVGVTRDNETMIRGTVVFLGRGVHRR